MCFLTVRKGCCYYSWQPMERNTTLYHDQVCRVYPQDGSSCSKYALCLGAQDTARFPTSAKTRCIFFSLRVFALPFRQTVIKNVTLHTSINLVFTTKIKTRLCECWGMCWSRKNVKNSFSGRWDCCFHSRSMQPVAGHMLRTVFHMDAVSLIHSCYR